MITNEVMGNHDVLVGWLDNQGGRKYLDVVGENQGAKERWKWRWEEKGHEKRESIIV